MNDNAKHFAQLPKPSYYAVIFSSLRIPNDNGYARTAERMVELAKLQPGYLGVESARGADGFGITVSYWKDEASIHTQRLRHHHAAHAATHEESTNLGRIRPFFPRWRSRTPGFKHGKQHTSRD